MNQRQNSAHHKRALKEARMAKLLFSFIALASIAIVIFILIFHPLFKMRINHSLKIAPLTKLAK